MKNQCSPTGRRPTARAVADAARSSPHPGRLLRELCRGIGPRPPASAGMRRAQELLGREWRLFGARVRPLEPVTFRAWPGGRADLAVTAPERRRLAAIQAIHSAAGIVTGRLVDGGRLAFGDLLRRRQHVAGAVVLMDGHVVTGGQFEPVQKRISLADAAGAAGVLIVGGVPRLPSIQFLNRARIPVATISAAAGRWLRRQLRRRVVRVRLRTTGRSRAVTCHNLVGELGPARGTTEQILAVAHLDTFYLSPAAIDNTSGVVTMTELARALAPYQRHFVRTLRFVAFTGEEYGYAGSNQYVRDHAGALDGIRCVWSMDCMFAGTARGVAVMAAPNLRTYIARALRGHRPRVDVRNRFCMSSDYLPFLLAGVPAARPADWHDSFPPYTHTVLDTDDKVATRWLQANAAMSAVVLLRLLTDPRPLPTRRLSPAQVLQMVRREGVEDLLRWQVLLPS